MKKAIKIIVGALTGLIIATLILVGIFLIIPEHRIEKNRSELNVKSAAEISDGGDYIHFLSTGSSDAILIESNGMFAMVDSGEDTDNPRGFEDLELEGFEEKVLKYLKDNAADENGKVHLDFILGTHSHSDHIGGFDTIVSDGDIEIGRAYLKEYDSSKIRDMEIIEWDNQEVYDQMVQALKMKGVEHEPPHSGYFS